eukprot:CAMPEP_0202007692 /NCGR_PEP_ID=MMETSP0905-20130828/12099_1 /ASSEMBLY_ACC=CAM_ASM_000554 /TAXON_ID=420261 /ORGANISM="Thalassiosira antarctica, Strain CCMP982" /LENGTH=778 /DNA_ID=CAMNT_0048565689 /DNA_START=279 /DNA_END=2615 /DNA_ORIENTATION=+
MAAGRIHHDDFAKLRLPCSTTQIRKMRRRRNPITIRTRFAWSLLLFTLTCVKVVMNHQVIFVGAADSMMDDSKPTDVNDNSEIDSMNDMDSNAARIVLDKDENGEDNTAKYDSDSPTGDPLPLPASLMKATRVGAKLRQVQNPQQEHTQTNPDDASQQSERMNPTNIKDVEEVPPNSKAPLTGCHFGVPGCNKGKRSAGTTAGAAAGEMNASSVEAGAEDSPQQGEDAGIKSPNPPSSSTLAGSATAKIEARVMKKGRGRKPTTLSQRSRPGASSPNVEPTFHKEAHHRGTTTGHSKPPHGFKLAGRVVTSPSDGLSYFLDAPRIKDDSEDNGGDWMMTIPYAYLECGPTIESTTEAFSLADMVLRHFPASASMGHWTNLGGGVTIENERNEGDESEGSTKYIEGNQEGNPKLIVALSPIEITVSGNNEEARIFNPGEVILMEDTLGKGHKMKAAPSTSYDKAEPTKKHDAHGQDLSVLMVSLPHTVHFPINDWLEETSHLSSESTTDGDKESPAPTVRHSSASASSTSPPTSYDAQHALYGFAPKHLHHEHRRLRKRSSFATNTKNKPCPLEYDSAYSSLFMPTHNTYRKHGRNRRNPRWVGQSSKDSSFDESYPPPPGFTTYEKESIIFHFLPSLRRTMLFGLGLSLASSFIYCVQLLYPPFLVLWGGATIVISGAFMNVLVTRWGYRNWVANWVEEWRWKREVRKMLHNREGAGKKQEVDEDVVQEDIVVEGDTTTTLQSNADTIDSYEGTDDHGMSDETELGRETEAENMGTAL